MVGVDQEPLEVRAENLLLGFLAEFDELAKDGLVSKQGVRYTEDEIATMREKIKAAFRKLLVLTPNSMREFANVFEKTAGAPISQMSLDGITNDKGVREKFRLFLVEALRELAGDAN